MSAGRLLGRTEQRVPPILWRFDVDAPGVVPTEAGGGPAWVGVDAASAGSVHLRAGDRLALRVHIADLTARRTDALQAALRRVGRPACDDLIAVGCEGADFKAGRVMHRLQTWRAAGLARAILVEAADAADAFWLVEHTPAHGVLAPFGPRDATARHHVLAAAVEMGVAVIATDDGADAIERVGFALAHDEVCAAEARLTGDIARVVAIARAAERPWEAARRDQAWDAFAASTPPPAPPRSGHPPAFAD